MKQTIITLLVLLSLASTAAADDSIALGVRYGGEINNDSHVTENSEFYEVFGDLYLNRLISIGATLAYSSADHKTLGDIRREDSYPITALFKVHVPIPFIQPYAGLGQSVIFNRNQTTTGSPVAFVGANISPLPMPLFLNLEYRHQFNGGDLDYIAGGVGIKF